jgi:ATP-dependent helicase/nuclease subunit A
MSKDKPAPGPAGALSGSASAPKWTEAQLRGITATGHSILVSAAAGSGKTAMLAARCAHLVCDTPDCDADELLVVTFTEAAAAQMKSRIHKAVRDRALAKDSERLRRQVALVERASVGTLHSFCARLLREHFHAVGLDPAFTVLDGEEAALLRREVARSLFDDRYELDAAGDFHRFIDSYGEGDDARLIRRVIQTHEMLASLVDPAGWIERSRWRIAQAAELPLEQTELGQELTGILSRTLADLRSRCQRAIELVGGMRNFPRYVATLTECSQVLRFWHETLADDGIDALREHVCGHDPPRLAPVASGTPGRDIAKAAVDSVREPMRKGLLCDVLRFTSEQWKQGLEAIGPHAGVFLGLVEEFAERYRLAKDASRVVDFSDLERLALQVLRDEGGTELQPSAAARAYHKRFKHVLVDEYQDINEVQDAILSLLSRECLCEEPGNVGNLFCVGDVKQSIYRFRLAEAQRFLDRQKLFRGPPPREQPARGEVIDLQSNFRSRQPLLEAINGIFERLMSEEAVDIEYDTTHRLHAGLRYPASDGKACFTGAPIEMHLLPDDLTSSEDEEAADPCGEAELDRTEREAALVARRIRRLMGLDGSPASFVSEKDATGTLTSRPIRFSDIVILLRSLRYKSEQYADVLRRAGIPVHAQSGSGYFDSMEVRDMLALLSVLDNQRQDIPLATVLRSPLANLHFRQHRAPDASCSLSSRERAGVRGGGGRSSPASPHPSPLPEGEGTGRESPRVEDSLREGEGIGMESPGVEDSLARIRLAFPATGDHAVPFHDAVVLYAQQKDDDLSAQLNSFLTQLENWRQLAHRRPLAEFIQTIYEQTGYLAFCAGLHDGAQRVANLMDLAERAGQFGTFHRQSLSRFMQFLQSLRDEAELGQPSVASEADNVVRVMSIHRSKGLEFPVVVLPDLGKGVNFTDCQGTILTDRTRGLGMAVVDERKMIRYPSLASVIVQQRLKQQSLAEELRVLYVAMTRAREHLILIGTCESKEPEKWSSRWSNYAGAFPGDMILGARCLLDWLGPVVAAQSPDTAPVIEVTRHTAEEVMSWEKDHSRRPVLSPEQSRLAALQPLVPVPAPDPAAREVIARLGFSYPFARFTSLAAAQAVTRLANHGAVATQDASAVLPSQLPKPKFLADVAASASDIGTSTHLVLSRLDFSRPCIGEDLSHQIAAMVQRRSLSDWQAKMVNQDAIGWLIGSEVGALLKTNAGNLRREAPIHFSVAASELAPSDDLQDRVMVRGRIDVLIPTAQGGILIDYKTDNISPAAVPFRAQHHDGQLEQYREAIGKITGMPVCQTFLVFLRPRVIWSG